MPSDNHAAAATKLLIEITQAALYGIEAMQSGDTNSWNTLGMTTVNIRACCALLLPIEDAGKFQARARDRAADAALDAGKPAVDALAHEVMKELATADRSKAEIAKSGRKLVADLGEVTYG